MGSSRAVIWSEKSRMITLDLLRPFAKLILSLLLCILLYFTFNYFARLHQKIGELEQSLSEKQQQLKQQGKNIQSIRSQVLQQYQAISNLQKVQADLQVQSEQRQITLKEIFSNDETAKSWATQPIPNSVRRLFNNSTSTSTANGSGLSHP